MTSTNFTNKHEEDTVLKKIYNQVELVKNLGKLNVGFI